MSGPPTTYFVTGGTGFIGRRLVERLLGRGGEVRLLVRPGQLDTHSARIDAWQKRAHDLDGVLAVVEGDVSEPGLGLADPGAARTDHVVHLAAVYDLDAAQSRLHEVNVAGTRRVLELLDAVGFGGTLHHVSSIAVAGSYAGRFAESMLDEGQSWPHPYQRSKLESERQVRAWDYPRKRIYRPGAVVGDSSSGEADRLDGAYYLFGLIARLRDLLPNWLPLAAPRGPGMPIVPVDFVADAIDHLAHAEGLDGQTFHVLDPATPSARRTLDALSRAAHGPRVRYALPTGRFKGLTGMASMVLGKDAIDHWKQRVARRFGAPASVFDALNTRVSFATDALERGLQGSGLSCPPLGSYAKSLWRYYEDHLDPYRDREARTRALLDGRRVVITGASSGVGEALALVCARYGARLALVARRADRLEAVAAAVRETGGEALVVAADLADLAACDRVVKRVLDELGGADVLVNNAGKSIRRRLVDSIGRFHDFERTMQLNYFAAVRLTMGLLPAMREQGGGLIVNMLTSGIFVGSPYFGSYLPSKRALDAFSDSLAAELHHEGIRVCDVYLPLVNTPMIAPSGAYDDAPMMEPEHAARWILAGMVDRKRRLAPLWAKLIGLAWVLDPGGQTRSLNTVLRATSSDKAERTDVAVERRLLRLLGVRGPVF